MSNITPKPVKIFTRDLPVTKVDLHNCFCPAGQYVKRAVVEARGEIGLNAIKYLLKNDYATRFEERNVDYWKLTADGEEWLRKGLARHLELHPEEVILVNSRSAPVAPVRRRRKL